MDKFFRFTKTVTPTEWRALPREFKAGSLVRKFVGHDYGCVNDDWRFGKVKSIACQELTGGAFFTVPADVLEPAE